MKLETPLYIAGYIGIILLFVCIMAILVRHDAHGQVLVKQRDYGQLWLQPDVCDTDGAIRWRIVPPTGPVWDVGVVTPVGRCLVLTKPLWDAWTRGWLEGQCIYSDGREWGAWVALSNTARIASDDGRCQ